MLLKNARAIVHSGGIGAIGWSLRFGMQSLLVPSSWDQFDNAYRAQHQKLASVMAQGDYKAPAIASELNKLFNNQPQRDLLQSYTGQLSEEDGAAVACMRIEAVLRDI